jgi:FkbM family methyltransferase
VSRLTLIEAAVFTATGESWFSSEESNSGSLSQQEQKLTVKTIDLAAEAARWKAERLLLKMDIEGVERLVLPKIVKHLPTQCAIFLEGHGGTQAWKELSAILTGAGFQVLRTRERGSFIDGFALRG